MDKPPGKTESTDGSSIKPVSSLRSHFENMLNRQSSSADAPRPVNPRQSLGNIFDGPEESRTRADGPVSAKLAAKVPDEIPAGCYC
ncbi:hypothetical protein SLS58_003675 [Diplodia intermedia]|uniref:Uncharacterized protein n=1 Tax=Diplodia intermedia TaxID=856260 RepID=A0ABR3TVZ6_9PEZI